MQVHVYLKETSTIHTSCSYSKWFTTGMSGCL